MTEYALGSTNKAAVKIIQNLLNQRGAVPQLAEDGDFGAGTLAAVKDYQGAVWGIGSPEQDSIVGPATLSSLRTVPSSNYQMYVTTKGATTHVQQLLNAKGAGLDIDGVWGSGTETAVVGFQSANLVTTDGIVGPRTLGLLEGAGKPIPPAAPGSGEAPIPLSSVTFGTYTGSSGSEADGEAWADQACAVLGVPTTYWVPGFLTMMGRESSYGANAVNNYDSNATSDPSLAADGYPVNCSRGCAQTIPTTFAAHHQPATSTDIYDPVASLCAAANYVCDDYGVSRDGHDLAEKVQQFDSSRPAMGY